MFEEIQKKSDVLRVSDITKKLSKDIQCVKIYNIFDGKRLGVIYNGQPCESIFPMEELNNMEIVDIDMDTDEYTLVLFVSQGE